MIPAFVRGQGESRPAARDAEGHTTSELARFNEKPRLIALNSKDRTSPPVTTRGVERTRVVAAETARSEDKKTPPAQRKRAMKSLRKLSKVFTSVVVLPVFVST